MDCPKCGGVIMLNADGIWEQTGTCANCLTDYKITIKEVDNTEE